MTFKKKTESHDGFIVNRTNRDAVRKCFSLASENKRGFILFVQGKSPCGKTHLMKAVAQKYQETFSDDAVVVTFKEIVNDYINSIKNKYEKFYDKYMKTGLILIDDFHCGIALTSTQESLAEIFKKFIENGINIILFSEYERECYDGLDELYCEEYFSVVEIKKADLSLRKNFLIKVLTDEDVTISKRVFRHIIFNKKFNISAIKGCVSKIKLMKETDGTALKDRTIIEKIKEYEG